MTLVDKHRGTEWDDIYGNEHIKTVLMRTIKNDTTQHMIFVGRPGCGKTMTALIYASKYLGTPITYKTQHPDFMMWNASDARGIDVIRSRKFKGFFESKCSIPGKKRIIVLDEADGLTPEAQAALRALSENNQDNIIMIMCMNHLEKIKEKALLSRCMVFKFDPEPPEMLKQYFLDVAKKEKVFFADEFAEEIVDDIVNFSEYRGDFRRVINDTLQKLVGIEKPVTKADVPWIYSESYINIIDEILRDPLSAYNIFFSKYQHRYIDPVLFVKQLFMRYRKKKEMSFKLAEIFGTVEMNLKNGGDDLVQTSYLLTAITSESEIY